MTNEIDGRGGSPGTIGWFGIVRLGLVQAALGSIVVLATSTINRVMVVELALPAIVPGALVALHYLIQIARPRLGYGSDQGGSRAPWIVGGMAVLALGGIGTAGATAFTASHRLAGLGLALLAFLLVGSGVGAAGTSLLALLAKRVAPQRRAAAASIVWVMMIAGFAITSGAVSHLLDPFSMGRLIQVSAEVGAVALLVTVAAVWGIEGRSIEERSKVFGVSDGRSPADKPENASFAEALAGVWREPRARRFVLFVFVAMLGYSAQELILEPFAGAVLALTPAQSANVTSMQHTGALIGMIVVALAGSVGARGRFGSMRTWTVGGCFGSAAGLGAVALAGIAGPGWPLLPSVLFLGAANGAFAVAAIGAMMGLAAEGKSGRTGLRMGLFGAAQAVAFAFGGIVATVASDLARLGFGSPATAYAVVFAGEAVLFMLAARLAVGVFRTAAEERKGEVPQTAQIAMAATGG